MNIFLSIAKTVYLNELLLVDGPELIAVKSITL